MNTKWKIIGVAAAILCVLAIVWSRQQARIIPAAPHQEAPVSPIAQTPVPIEQASAVGPVPAPQVQPAPKPKSSPQIQAQNPAVKPAKEPLHDPDARDALALVGLDPEAEQYWLEAIYDSSLPDNEREDLMEDLNETGFADPKNLTANDLPLIVNRLEIINAVLPNADDFMTSHLLEAQKDLVNMYARVAPR